MQALTSAALLMTTPQPGSRFMVIATDAIALFHYVTSYMIFGCQFAQHFKIYIL